MIQTKYGKVEGFEKDGCTVYLGIPFAKPPVGDLAFKHPVPPEPWGGILQANKGGHNPIQYSSKFSVGNVDRDCLYLNVFVPNGAEGPLPVMVWVFGGAFATGGAGALEPDSQNLLYDLSRFARETKTIVVSFNYRLNIFGFLNFNFLRSDFDRNNGLYDQIMAMKYVKENIAAFGGDPDNITAFGESAGAASVLALMTMDDAKGLFNKVILQSPCAGHFYTEEQSEEKTRLFLTIVGLSDPDQFKKMPLENLSNMIKAYSVAVILKGEMRCPFEPTIDGITLKEDPRTAVSRSDMPMMIGFNSQEGNLFVGEVPSPFVGVASWFFKLGPTKEGETNREHACDALTKDMFTDPISAVVENHAGKLWYYKLAYSVSNSKIGSCHASDLPILFGADKTMDNVPIDYDDPVGKMMREMWSGFAWRTDPGWPEYKKGDEPHVIDKAA